MTVERHEIDAAVEAVRRATRLTTEAQRRLAVGDVLTKGDDSPVTVADFGAQAIVCAALTEALGEVAVVGEENADDLSTRPEMLDGVTRLVSAVHPSATPATVLEAIALGSAEPNRDRFWTLDPIDGTKGFLRGEQYAIALALVERGQVVLGVLGCPNLPNPDATIQAGSGTAGALFVAANGATTCLVGPSDEPQPVRTDDPPTVAEARFCESVEAAHSDHDLSATIADRLGIRIEPYRIDSQCKYAAVARGDASIYLRLPTRADYVEKIWDHAAGAFVVEQAGGRVTDTTGAPLDFGCGRRLERNVGVIATSGGIHDEVVAAVGETLKLGG